MKSTKTKHLIRKTKEKASKEMQLFHKEHWLKSNDLLTLVLKSHLYIENCLDNIFTLVLPYPKKIIKKRFSSKVDIFESLGSYPSHKILEKIRTINKIRNKFAHNLKYKISTKDLQPLVKDLKDIKGETNVNKLKAGLNYVIGYLHALQSQYKLFPFTTNCMDNNKIFKREDGYKFEKIYKMMYPDDELRNFLSNNMKMKN